MIVIIENGQRRIPVQFAKRVVGRRMYGGQSTYIPLKVNQAGVIPIIFASSVLYLPLIITNVLPTGGWGDSVREFVDKQPRRRQRQLLVAVRRHPRPARHRLRVLLHGDRLRPRPPGRPDPQAGRLHPRHPARARRPSATSPRCCRASRCPGAVFIAAIAVLPVIMLTAFNVAELPVRRHHDPDRRRRRPRDDEADRQPADDAQLRGLPEVGAPARRDVFARGAPVDHDAPMIPGARLVLLGRQGAGKGTQCVRLARHYVVPHISTGDMLRMAVKEGTDFGRKAKEYMDAGELLPDDVIVGIVAERLGRDDTSNRGYVLDGFPRTVGQAEALAEITETAGQPLDLVVDLEVPEEVVIERISKRRVCVDCGTNYSVDAPPRYDWTCDVCGGDVAPAGGRHRGGDPPPPRPLPRADRAAHPLVPGPRPARRRRRPRPPRRRHPPARPGHRRPDRGRRGPS